MEVNLLRFSCVALVVVGGCSSRPVADAEKPETAFQWTAIEARAALVFPNAVLLKPRETLPANDLTLTLAPLLIQEVAGAESKSNASPTTVYCQLGAVEIAGINHPQMTYLWAWGKATRTTLGVRLTLNSHGFPVIWEVLDDRAAARVVFVSRSLEEKARTAFGSVAVGRRFAVEREQGATPDVVVARVIEDGPMAMGPIVHQMANGEINAVICRCMPTQARHLVATAYYELKPLSGATTITSKILKPNDRLVEKLRLPPDF